MTAPTDPVMPSAEVLALRDLSSALVYVRPTPGLHRVAGPEVWLHGADPVPDEGEAEIARYDGAITLLGDWADTGLGQHAFAGGIALVTDRRLVITLMRGTCRHGTLAEDTAVAVLSVPWVAVQEISRPERAGFGDRIAGGTKLQISNHSTAVFVITLIASSHVSPPPGSKRTAKVTTKDVHEVMGRTAALALLPTAPPSLVPVLIAARDGRFTLSDEAELSCWLVNPGEDTDGATEPQRYGLSVEADTRGQGLLVVDVNPTGASHRAGVQCGHRILSVDGVPLHAPEDLATRLATKSAGDVSTLRLLGEGGTGDVQVQH